MRRILFAGALALSLLSGCAALPSKPGQAMAAAEVAYTSAARAEASYISRPGADPAVVARIRALDNDAYAALLAARASSDAGQPVRAAVALAASAAVTQYLMSQGAR